MQLYGEVGGCNGGKAFVLDEAGQSCLKNGGVALGKGAHCFLFRCHLKGTLFVRE